MTDKNYGSFAISRKLKNSWLHPSNENRKFTKYEAWLWIIENARFACSDKTLINEKLIIIPRGYFTTTVDFMVSVFKWNKRTVEKFLQLLEQDCKIKRFKVNPKSKRSYTLLKVNNYNDYQPEIASVCTSKYKSKCTLNCTSKCTLYKKEYKKGNKKEILSYLNQMAKTNFKPVDSNLKLINARLNEYTEAELKAMIDCKVSQWANDEKMSVYLRPSTLFNATKCNGYLEESRKNVVSGNAEKEMADMLARCSG